MLFATGRQPGGYVRQPLMLKGDDSGPDQTVTTLQVALANLATKTSRPLINPGPPNGIVDDGTMRAVVNALDLLADKLQGTPKLAVQAALLAGSGSTIARNAVASYAVELTVAANAAADAYGQTPIVYQPVAPSWYKQPYGIVIIIGVLLVGYRLFFARPHIEA
jgi:hypothetical protein